MDVIATEERRPGQGRADLTMKRPRRRRRRHSRQGARHRTEGGSRVLLRADTDGRADGRRGQEGRRGTGSTKAVSIGYPGPVLHGRPVAEPRNLGPGWVGFDYRAAFGCPVKVVNDAAMQALGSYQGGKMLFLGLGTGLGSTLIVDGIVEPMELGHLPYREGTFEEYVGLRGLQAARARRNGGRTSRTSSSRLIAALEPDDVVLGGGNVHELDGTASRLSGRRQRQRVPRRVPTVAASARQASRCTAIRGITRLEIEE